MKFFDRKVSSVLALSLAVVMMFSFAALFALADYSAGDDSYESPALASTDDSGQDNMNIAPTDFTHVASGTMDDFPNTGTTRAEGTATWRIEQRYAPEHPFLQYVRTLYIGEPGVTGALNRPGALGAMLSTPWDRGGLNNWNDSNIREITRIVFLGPVVAGENLAGLFNNLLWVESIENIHYLDTSATTNMAQMFRSVGNMRLSGATGAFLTPTWFRLQLDLSTFDTSNVTSMYGLFQSMPLDYLNLSGWDTSSVTTMQNMFFGVHYLENLDVSHFNTSNVTNMRQMFAAHSQSLFGVGQILGRNSFTHLDVSNFDTSNVETMDTMFYGSAQITRLDVSNFDLSSLTSSLAMQRMFQGMHSLVELDLRGWDTKGLHANAMQGMFINNYTWDSRLNPTEAQNIPNIRILHLGPNFQFRATATGLFPQPGTRTFLPTVPGSSNLALNTQWLGAWQEIGTGTIERPNGEVRTSTQLMYQNNQMPGAGTWVWRPRVYNIVFDANRGAGIGTGTMANGQPRHPDFVENYTTANNAFTKTGYAFVGWNTAADGTGTSFPDGHKFEPWTLTGDKTLFAQWTARTDIQVTFNANHGVTPATSTQNVTFGGTYAAAFAHADVIALTNRTGYTFGGWFNTQANANGTTQDGQVLSADTVTNANAHTLWARWTPMPEFTVTFNSSGATGGTVPANRTYLQGSAVTVPGNTGNLVREGFAFAGWGFSPAGPAGTGFIMPESDVMLFAVWVPISTEERNFTVTFNSSGATGGTVPANRTYLQGSAVTVPGNTGNLLREGFTFAGWGFTATGLRINSFTMPASDITLFARWTPITPSPPVEDYEDYEDYDDYEEEIVEIEESEVPLEEGLPGDITTFYTEYQAEPSDDDGLVTPESPLISIVSEDAWTLLNFIITIIGALFTILISIHVLLQKRRERKSDSNENTRRRPIWLAVTVVLAIASAVLFILTQDMSLSIALIDWWTIAHIVILQVQIIAIIQIIKHCKRIAEQAKF